MNLYIITYIEAFYKVKTVGYIKASNEQEALENFGIVDEILEIRLMSSQIKTKKGIK